MRPRLGGVSHFSGRLFLAEDKIFVREILCALSHENLGNFASEPVFSSDSELFWAGVVGQIC
jgi:hypothetical protein